MRWLRCITQIDRRMQASHHITDVDILKMCRITNVEEMLHQRVLRTNVKSENAKTDIIRMVAREHKNLQKFDVTIQIPALGSIEKQKNTRYRMAANCAKQ